MDFRFIEAARFSVLNINIVPLGSSLMGGLRGKLLITLVVYFAGFATAIYLEAPALDGPEMARAQSSNSRAENKETTRAEVFADKVHENLLDYISIAEEQASKVGALVKARLEE